MNDIDGIGDHVRRIVAGAKTKGLPVSPEVAAYNEAWRVHKALFERSFDPSTVGTDPKYIENRLLSAFESGWNGAMNWIESRTLKDIINGQ